LSNESGCIITNSNAGKGPICIIVNQEVLGAKLGSIIKLGNESTGSTSDENKAVGEIRGVRRKWVAGIVYDRGILRSGVDRQTGRNIQTRE
jgi:hypothetical protein